MNEWTCRRGHINDYTIYNNVHQCNACRRLKYKLNPLPQITRVKERRLNNLEKARIKGRIYRQVNKDKVSAHKAVAYALKTGKLIKPELCENYCKNIAYHAHHAKGYEKENKLSVEWLCRSCHKLKHK